MPEGRAGSAEERRREAERQLVVQMAVEAALGAIGTKYSAEHAVAVVDIGAGRDGSGRGRRAAGDADSGKHGRAGELHETEHNSERRIIPSTCARPA
jgi:hypothetical protein